MSVAPNTYTFPVISSGQLFQYSTPFSYVLQTLSAVCPFFGNKLLYSHYQLQFQQVGTALLSAQNKKRCIHIKTGQHKIEKTILLGPVSLHFCCNIQRVGSDCGLHYMKEYTHLVSLVQAVAGIMTRGDVVLDTL